MAARVYEVRLKWMQVDDVRWLDPTRGLETITTWVAGMCFEAPGRLIEMDQGGGYALFLSEGDLAAMELLIGEVYVSDVQGDD